MRLSLEKASAGHGRPRRDPRRHAGGVRATRPRPSKSRSRVARPEEAHEVPAGYRVAEIYFERRGGRSIVGNIYKGRVDNVLPGLEAAFVDIGLDKNGFLHVDEIVLPGRRAGQARPRRQRARASPTCSSPGQEIVVQVVKDPLKTKGARLSMELTIAGRYMVYAPTGEGVGVSRRLEDKERDRLRKEAKQLDLGGGGAIIRTAAHGATRADFERELQYLFKLNEVLEKRVAEARRRPRWSSRRPTSRCASCATSSPSTSSARSSTTRSSTTGWSRSSRAPRRSWSTASSCGRTTSPLFEAYGVEPVIDGMLERRVDLPSGGYLIIDYAEALTVIDVNTGSFTGKGKAARLEDTITKTNLEAAEEVVRPAAAARHRRHHRHRLHRHGPRAQPRRGAEGAAQGARRGPHEDLRGRDLAARPGRDDAPERHRRRARDHDQAVPGVPRRGRRQVRGDDRDRVRAPPAPHGQGGRRRTAPRPTCCGSTRSVTAWFIADGARELHALEEETGRYFHFEGSEGLPLDHFAVTMEGTRAEIEEHAVPFRAGEEVHVDLVEPHMYNDDDAVAKVDGYLIDVVNGVAFVGEKKLVRIEEAGRTIATRRARRRRRRGGRRGRRASAPQAREKADAARAPLGRGQDAARRSARRARRPRSRPRPRRGARPTKRRGEAGAGRARRGRRGARRQPDAAARRAAAAEDAARGRRRARRRRRGAASALASRRSDDGRRRPRAADAEADEAAETSPTTATRYPLALGAAAAEADGAVRARRPQADAEVTE